MRTSFTPPSKRQGQCGADRPIGKAEGRKPRGEGVGTQERRVAGAPGGSENRGAATREPAGRAGGDPAAHGRRGVGGGDCQRARGALLFRVLVERSTSV